MGFSQLLLASGLSRRCGPQFSPPRDSPTSTCSFLGLRQAPPEAQDHRQLQCNPDAGPRLPSRCLGTLRGLEDHTSAVTKLLRSWMPPRGRDAERGPVICTTDPPLRSRPALLPRPPPILPTLSLGPGPARRSSPASPPGHAPSAGT